VIEHEPCGYWLKDQSDTPPTGGRLFVTGYNGQGQLGLGYTIPAAVYVFTRVGSAADWKQVSAAVTHSAALKTNGTLWVTGEDTVGGLALGGIGNKTSFTQVGDGKYKLLSLGGYTTFVLHTDGTLWAAGRNDFGQLGLGDQVNRNVLVQVGVKNDWSRIAGGSLTLHALDANGYLYAAGNNYNGELGLGTTSDPVTTLQLVGFALGAVTQIDDGANCSYARTSDGRIYGTGSNQFGKLGLGTTFGLQLSYTLIGSDTDWVSVHSGTHFAFALKSNGTLWATGYNAFGQLGLGDDVNRTTFTQVGTDADWVSVGCGGNHVIAKKSNGTFWGAGFAANGQLGLGPSPPPAVYVLTRIGADADWSVMWTEGSEQNNHSFGLKGITPGLTGGSTRQPIWTMPPTT
jgi:alpha-tubulin suppressor-like RCC1 family protein